ncbi:MAG: HAMP domain-containing histidine kinase, partial [Sphingobacteriales bacterium]
MEQAFQKLEVANKEKDKILSVVAHDMRSPINSIYALADLLMMEDGLTDDQRETLGLIKTASQTSLSLSKEILESAIMMQSQELKWEEINLNELVAHSSGLLRFRAAEKGQQLVLQVPELVHMVLADRDKLQRVINNLITNAIKFSEQGKEITVLLRREADDVIISVKDQGIG